MMKNSRNKFAILFFLFSLVSMAQVGIGTPTPAATLDVTAASLTGTTVDGLLIPRVSRLRAQTMTGTPTSTIIYVDNIATGGIGTTINVTSVGFYFFNGTLWEKLGTAVSNEWALTGNSGLSGTTNFLGTTDNVDVAFRRNNNAAGKIGATSTAFGVNALTAGVATNNAAFGTNALRISTGADNVAVGNGTLSVNTSGVQNTGVGNSALPVNTGSANTAIGFQTLNANTGGNNGTAVGFRALARNTTASNNTAIGFEALTNNTTGTSNTSLGYQSALNTSNGNQNTAIGYQSLLSNSTGSNNTAIGRHALYDNTGSNNTAVGQQALLRNTSATGNTAVGSDALFINTGANNTALGFSAGAEHGTGANNTYVGAEAGRYNTFGTNNNSFLGYRAGLYSQGNFNVAVGSNSLAANQITSNNVAIGYNALSTNAGTANVAIGYNAGLAETGSNKLYITNTNTTPTTSLIYGEFSPTRILRTNSTFQIGDPAGTGYVFPVARGGTNQVLQTNATGILSWVNASALPITETDPQVSSVTTNAVPRWNGTTLVDGVITDDATNVGIGVAPSAGNKLDINGKTRATNFQMTNGGTNGYILQSDATGNASWVQNPLNTLSMASANITANQTLLVGWQKINFNTETFDTGDEFNTVNGRFTATKAGFYRINATYHTNNQIFDSQFSIAIYVNNGISKLNSSDHYEHGIVERSISGLLQLAVGDYVEIFAENFIASGVAIDSYFGKTFFEIQQVR
jgi:hypothetical protein